jgi:phosphatidylglycerophosphatase A
MGQVSRAGLELRGTLAASHRARRGMARLTLTGAMSTIPSHTPRSESPRKYMRNLVLFVATGAGSGYSPIAPGTAGAVVGLALFAASLQVTPPPFVLLMSVGGLVAISALGVWSSGRAEQIFARKDDGRITIDEVAGQWLALVALPARLEVLLTGLVLFRIFDIWKPPPVRQCERLGGGLGVMADDLVAGLYANAVGQLVFRVAIPLASSALGADGTGVAGAWSTP